MSYITQNGNGLPSRRYRFKRLKRSLIDKSQRILNNLNETNPIKCLFTVAMMIFGACLGIYIYLYLQSFSGRHVMSCNHWYDTVVVQTEDDIRVHHIGDITVDYSRTETGVVIVFRFGNNRPSEIF